MAMVVQHNMQAANSNRMLGITTSAQAKSTEKLSSGYKINRAADDAAGLTISEKMRKQIRGLDRASTNAQDGVSAVQTAEGALTEVHSMLQRMNELSTQAANGTNSESDRGAIQDEISQLTTEIDRVAETTKFNETYLLKGGDGTKSIQLTPHDAGLTGTFTDNGDGTANFTMAALSAGSKVLIGGTNYTIVSKGTESVASLNKIQASTAYKYASTELVKANAIGVTGSAAVVSRITANKGSFKITAGKAVVAKALSFNLHVGSDADMTNKINVNIETMNSSYLGIHGLNVKDENGMGATYAIDAIGDAISKVSEQRSSLGAVQNRLEHTIANLDNISENTTSAESRIRDTDMAKEMVEYSKNNILAQAGQAMLAQANQSTQGVLSLLQG